MAFSIEKYNGSRRFDVDTTGFDYKKLTDFYNDKAKEQQVYPVTGFFVNTKGIFGDAPVMTTKNSYVDLPKFLLQTVKDIINDDDAVAAINAGKVGFKVYEYEQKKYKRVCYGITFCDIK